MLKRIAPMVLVAMMLFATGTAILWSTPTQAAQTTRAAAAALGPQTTLTHTGSITAGAYIVQLALGCGCHFNPPLGGLAGGDNFSGPGAPVLFSRNITPDPLTGIGNYTEAELETVLRTGRRPNGEQLHPAMPYMAFSGIAENDMDDLVAFLLFGQAPISNTIPPRQLLTEPAPFTPTVPAPATAPVTGVLRGEYIVNVLGDCRGCHGPNLGGTPGFAPNITSDPVYGIGLLSVEQLSTTLHTGVRPTISGSLRFDGTPVGSIMAMIIQSSIQNWTQGDVTGVAEYLKTVPAVGNQPPLFVAQPNVSAAISTSYVYTAAVADFNVFDTLTVTAPTKPGWLTLGPTNHSGRPVNGAAVLSGTPTTFDVGANPVVLVVTDAAGLATTQVFTITVTAEPTGLDPNSPAGKSKLYLPAMLQ